MAKDLAVVTILSLCALTVEAAPSAPNLNPKQAQLFVNRLYDKNVELCGMESGCLAKAFRKEFKRAGFATKTVLLSHSAHQPLVKINTDQGDVKSFDLHAVTIVRLIGGWRVVDPVVLQSAQLEKFTKWETRVHKPVERSVR